MAYVRNTQPMMGLPPLAETKILQGGDPEIGGDCILCDVAFTAGDIVAPILGGPGVDTTEQAKATSSQTYDCLCLWAHRVCIRGQ